MIEYDPIMVAEAELWPWGSPEKAAAIIAGYPEWMVFGRLHDPINGQDTIIDGSGHFGPTKDGLSRRIALLEEMLARARAKLEWLAAQEPAAIEPK